ncbi:Transcriptional regulator, TetR family [Microbacterium esteraromaticum]|uniref:Transcriptional regulator, TetR family n=1 Tax=Microbacterium esteraromaticum TaxID=57043 RepID=A0A1R4KNK2_9MICO|nr:Transcriptional regulator, TetR family [Microbacterium esteraromaticum]
MPRTTEQNEALRSATRSAVETAAVRVFAHRGFAATNMRQIAVEAGISTGSIYRHYASKEELFDELIDQASRGLGAVAAQLSTERDPILHRGIRGGPRSEQRRGRVLHDDKSGRHDGHPGGNLISAGRITENDLAGHRLAHRARPG